MQLVQFPESLLIFVSSHTVEFRQGEGGAALGANQVDCMHTCADNEQADRRSKERDGLIGLLLCSGLGWELTKQY